MEGWWCAGMLASKCLSTDGASLMSMLIVILILIVIVIFILSVHVQRTSWDQDHGAWSMFMTILLHVCKNIHMKWPFFMVMVIFISIDICMVMLMNMVVVTFQSGKALSFLLLYLRSYFPLCIHSHGFVIIFYMVTIIVINCVSVWVLWFDRANASENKLISVVLLLLLVLGMMLVLALNLVLVLVLI